MEYSQVKISKEQWLQLIKKTSQNSVPVMEKYVTVNTPTKSSVKKRKSPTKSRKAAPKKKKIKRKSKPKVDRKRHNLA